MDFKVSNKETRYQPTQGETFDVLVDDVFDFYPVFSEEDPNEILDFETLTTEIADIQQGALYAILRQRGSDPVDLERGVRWSSAVMGEIMGEALITDIKIESQRVSTAVSIVFDTYKDSEGTSFLSFTIKVVN